MKEVPIWEKAALTIEEAAAYSNIGIHKLREITDKDDSFLVLWVGKKRLIKRKALEKYIDQTYSI
nr:MAG TPA: excisionase [Caudoviricetes sp.]